MIKGAVILLVIAFFHVGSAIECYTCKNCGNDLSKATKMTCSGQQQCVSYAFSFPAPVGADANGKDCATIADNCNDYLNKVKDELRPQHQNIDQVAPVTTCVFCKHDNCNSAISLIKPSLLSLVTFFILLKMY